MSQHLEMTPARRIALLIGTPLAVLMLAWAGITAVAYAGQGDYPVRLRVPVAAGRTASVSITSGAIALSEGTAGRLAVTGTAHYAIWRSSLTPRRTASGVAVNGECHQVTGPCWFDLGVAVARGTRTEARVDSGDITASGLSARMTLSDTSGSITLTSVSGDVGVFAQSGLVTGFGISGPRLNVTDDAGTISLSDLTVPVVTVSDASGDITLAFTSVPDSVTVSDMSGNITLILPQGPADYNVTARKTSGSSYVGVPQNSSSRHVISVTTQSGDIRIAR